MGGFSLGAIVTIALVNAHPDDYAGIFPWDGFLFSNDPGVVGQSENQCATFELAGKPD